MPNRRDEHPERRAAEIVQARTGSDPHFSSLDLGWRWIAVQRGRLSPTRFSLPALESHLIAVHLQGAPTVACLPPTPIAIRRPPGTQRFFRPETSALS